MKAAVLFICGTTALRQSAHLTEMSTAEVTTKALTENNSALNRLVNQLKGMHKAVVDEKEQERVDHKKRQCYCNTNTLQKEAAVKKANEVITTTKAALADADGMIAAKTAAIADADKSIEEDSKSLSDMRRLRQTENEEFNKKNIEMTKNVKALESAVTVLSSYFGEVADARSADKAAQQAAKQAAIDSQAASAEVGLPSLLQENKNFLSAIDIKVVSRLAKVHFDPVFADEITNLIQNFKKQVGQKLVQLPGGNHNPASGQILGMMKELFNQMNEDWTELKNVEREAHAEFSKDAATREQSIADMRTKKEADERSLAENQQLKADADFKIQQKTKAIAADELFLKELRETCADADEIFVENQKMRSDEEAALSEVIKQLTSDETRNLFKGFNRSFLQTNTEVSDKSKVKVARNTLLNAFRRSGDQAMLQLTQKVGLDAFAKLKQAFTALEKQLEQKREDEKQQRDTCISQANELKLTSEQLQGDLDKYTTMKKLSEDAKVAAQTDMEKLKEEAGETTVSVEEAADNYIRDSRAFQLAAGEGKAMAKVLTIAKDRLAQFYDNAGQKSSQNFLQMAQFLSAGISKPKAIARAKVQGQSGGVLEFMEQMIVDFNNNVKAETVEEQKNADDYKKSYKSSIASLGENSAEQSRTAKAIADLDSDIMEAATALKNTFKQHESKQAELEANTQTCSFLLQNFDQRQNGYTVEIEAIREAKAILSGMQ